MKKTGIILFFTFTFPFFAVGEEVIQRESIFTQSQKYLEENRIPWVPAFFAGKVNDHWIGIGFLLNSPGSLGEDSPFYSLMRQFPFFQVALLLQGKTISSSIMFSYEKENFWGLSARFSF